MALTEMALAEIALSEIALSEMALAEMRSEIRDYTAILAKREQINGVVGDPSYMNVKIR